MSEKKATRDRILDETSKLVHKKGFRYTSLAELLEASRVKKGTLYYHFSSKDELGLAVLERAIANFIEPLDNMLNVSTPAKSLRIFFKYVLTHHRKNGFRDGCLFGNTALEMSNSDNLYSEYVKKLFNEWISRIKAVIQAGQKAGKFRSDIPSLDLAQMIVSTIEGGIMLSRLRKEEAPLKKSLDALKLFLYKK